MLFRTTFLKNCDGVSVPLSHSHDLCFFQSSERLDQSFDSLLFIDIFIVLDFILDQLIDHLHAKPLKGFKSKQGKNFDAIVAFDGDYNTTFVFPEKKCKSSYPKKRK